MQSEFQTPIAAAGRSYGGTSQGTRLLLALEPASAPVDDRSEAELLVWAAGFSQVVNFFNTQNRSEGDWQPFLVSEPIVQYAMIDRQDMDLRAAVLQEQLSAWLTPPSPEQGVLAEGNLLTLLYDQCQRINRWQVFFSSRAEEKVFAGAVVSAIELTLSKALDAAQHWEHTLAECGPDILSTFKLDNDLRSFDIAMWRLGMGPSWSKRVYDWRKRELPGILVSAHQAEAGLVTAGRARLQTLLAAPAQLAPHFALFLAFLRQLKLHAQAQLNELTGQHLKLFYQTILEERPAQAVPDRAYVVPGMAPGIPKFQLLAGTKLTAKGAAGETLVYGLDEPVDMTGCSISQLLTATARLFTRAGPPLPPLSELVLCTSVEPLPLSARPLFGTAPAALPAEGATGFAVASPCLHLAAGHRNVWLTITFDVGDAVSSPAADSSVSLTLGTIDLSALAAEGIDFAYSGAAAWVKPAAPGSSTLSITRDCSVPGQEVAVLLIHLSPEDPPWVKFDPTKLSGTFDPGSAVLKILRRDAQAPACDSVAGSFVWLLESAAVTSMEIAVRVHKAPAENLANDQGPIAKGMPILPFGNAPAQLSSFFITYPELQDKLWEQMTLHLLWQNLPLDKSLYPGGLPDYYSAYAVSLLRMHPGLAPAPFTRKAYQVKVDGRAGGSWLPLEPILGVRPPEGEPRHLFDALKYTRHRTDDPTLRYSAYQADPALEEGEDPEAIAPQTKLAFTHVTDDPAASGQSVPRFDGGFRVQLWKPGYAFGHAIYPQVMTDVAMQNAEAMMSMAKGDSATADQIFDRWKEPVTAPAPPPSGCLAIAFHPRRRYRLPPQLFEILRTPDLPVPVFPGGVQGKDVIAALCKLENKSFTCRSELDRQIIAELKPPWPHWLLLLIMLLPQTRGLFWLLGLLWPPYSCLLLAIYRWIDRLLGGFPALQPLPPPPLTPALSAVNVSYSASASVSFAAEGGPDRCHQILPFATPLLLAQNGRIPPLLEPSKAGGSLFIGLLNVSAAQKVSLLFVLQDQRAGVLAGAPVWSVLCQGGWKPCTVKDETFGLQKSGRVQVVVPAEMDDQSPRMPPDPNGQRICWLCVQAQTPDCFPAVVQILPQAGVATFIPGNSVNARPLAAGSLKALQVPDARVKSILQPLPSFGGRAAESEAEFLTRVSERLRHKGRAWTVWDYERLLLQHFPGIFYARCLPHTRALVSGEISGPSRAPGHVQVVVLPLLAQAPAVLPPGFAAGELEEMESWLRERASPAVKLRVCNPAYETLLLSIDAIFDGSQPLGTVQAQLNGELREFISPWIYRPQTIRVLPPFEFHLATLRAFIQSRPYVKTLNACAYATTTQGNVDGDWIRPSNTWSMLVTAENHVFTSGTSHS